MLDDFSSRRHAHVVISMETSPWPPVHVASPQRRRGSPRGLGAYPAPQHQQPSEHAKSPRQLQACGMLQQPQPGMPQHQKTINQNASFQPAPEWPFSVQAQSTAERNLHECQHSMQTPQTQQAEFKPWQASNTALDQHAPPSNIPSREVQAAQQPDSDLPSSQRMLRQQHCLGTPGEHTSQANCHWPRTSQHTPATSCDQQSATGAQAPVAVHHAWPPAVIKHFQAPCSSSHQLTTGRLQPAAVSRSHQQEQSQDQQFPQENPCSVSPAGRFQPSPPSHNCLFGQASAHWQSQSVQRTMTMQRSSCLKQNVPSFDRCQSSQQESLPLKVFSNHVGHDQVNVTWPPHNLQQSDSSQRSPCLKQQTSWPDHVLNAGTFSMQLPVTAQRQPLQSQPYRSVGEARSFQPLLSRLRLAGPGQAFWWHNRWNPESAAKLECCTNGELLNEQTNQESLALVACEPAQKRLRGVAKKCKLEVLARYLEERGGHSGLVTDWETRIEVRKSGNSAGNMDVYWFSPEGKRFRSMAEVARHFQLATLTE